LTVLRARDLIVECFFQAQRETFERAKHRVGSTSFDANSIRSAVVAAVRLAFKESGDDFEHPSRESLARMVAVLARMSASWGTPDDVIAHHLTQVGRLLTALGTPQP